MDIQKGTQQQDNNNFCQLCMIKGLIHEGKSTCQWKSFGWTGLRRLWYWCMIKVSAGMLWENMAWQGGSNIIKQIKKLAPNIFTLNKICICWHRHFWLWTCIYFYGNQKKVLECVPLFLKNSTFSWFLCTEILRVTLRGLHYLSPVTTSTLLLLCHIKYSTH